MFFIQVSLILLCLDIIWNSKITKIILSGKVYLKEHGMACPLPTMLMLDENKQTNKNIYTHKTHIHT